MADELTALDVACAEYAEWGLQMEKDKPVQIAKERMTVEFYKGTPEVVHAVIKQLFRMLPDADMIEIMVIKHDYRLSSAHPNPKRGS